jgi:hypothetical protein
VHHAAYLVLLAFAAWAWFQRSDLAVSLLLLVFAQLVAVTFVLIDLRDAQRGRHRQ